MEEGKSMEKIKELIQQYLPVLPEWFCILYIVSLITGISVGLSNKKNFNCIFWLIIVFTIPGFGTIFTIIGNIIMNNLKKRNSRYNFDYRLQKIFIALPVFTASAGAVFSEQIISFYDNHIGLKHYYELSEDSIPLTFALITLFTIFMLSYREYMLSGVCFHINKILPHYQSLQKGKKIYNYDCVEETKNVIPETDIVSDIAANYYKGTSFRAGTDSWKYSITLNNNDYGFNVISYAQFRENLDVEKAEYCGKGLTRMTVLKWNDRILSGNNRNIPVKRYFLWHTMPSFMPYAVETLTSLMMIIVSCTPFGIELFQTSFSFFLEFFS